MNWVGLVLFLNIRIFYLTCLIRFNCLVILIENSKIDYIYIYLCLNL